MSEAIFKKDVKLEILISTMNRNSLSFLEAMFPHHVLDNLNILIINQTQKGSELFSNTKNIRVINAFEKGLSLSRNLALKNAIGNICLIADDDVEYVSNFEDIIVKAFEKKQNSSIIRFKIETFSGAAYKAYPKKSKRLIKKKDIENTSSIEIAFKRKDIIESNVVFNKFFGLGSYFQSGEEYLFLKTILNKGLDIYFEDETIVKHTLKRSTSNMDSDKYVKASAALYYEDYKNFSYIIFLKFIIFLARKRKMPLNKFAEKYKVGISAINSYKKIISETK